MCDDEPHQSELKYVLRLEHHAELQGARGIKGRPGLVRVTIVTVVASEGSTPASHFPPS